jgi:hypothetical protein
MKENIEKYINQDLYNPNYLFHGTSRELEKLEPRQSIDKQNKSNEDNAIFLTSWFINAAAYAFRCKLKELNEYYSFSINNDAELPVMTFEVENLPDDLSGYIYVFEKTEEMIKDNKKFTTQYRCYNELIPQKIIKVYYKDFEKYFKRIEK